MVRITTEAKETSRRRLLEAAASEFARHGLAGANVNEISLAAGLAKGTVYNYFPSKRELFLEVVRESAAAAATGAQAVPPDASVAERLRALVGADVAWVRENEDFARVLVRELLAGDGELYGPILEAAAPFLDKVLEIVRDGAARGEVRADVAPERLALTFAGLEQLALVAHWGSGGWPDLTEIPGLVVDLFLDGARGDAAR